MIFVGIDPGLHGAFAALDDAGDVVTVLPIPIIRPEEGRADYDLVACRALFGGYRAVQLHVTVEKLWPLPARFKRKGGKEQEGGTIANYNRGVSRGWAWMLTALQIPYELVPPQAWQRVMLAGIPGEDTGQRSILAAKKRWPRVDLRRSERARIDDDGKSDALLLAEFGRRKRMGGEVFAAAMRT